MDARATPTVTPVDATLGAVVTDVDLASLDDSVWSVLNDAFNRHALLIFPGQNLSAEAQVAFGERFGRIDMVVPHMKASLITNVTPNGEPLPDDDYRMQVMVGNQGWHTDASFMRVSSLASILSALAVPSHGGQTEWADMRAAYDALDASTRERIRGLNAYHSVRHSQARIGHDMAAGWSVTFKTTSRPLRPLVKTHPVTGRKSLFIGRHAYAIPGLGEAEAEQLLDELVTFACQPPRTYAHTWTTGDLVVWDNRCLLHRARPFDRAEQRIMRHVGVCGDPVTERALKVATAAT